MFGRLLPRVTLSTGAIIRWHVVTQKFAWLMDRLPQGGRILDVGCGRGEYPIELARCFPGVGLACGIDEMGRDAVGGFLPVPRKLRERVRLTEGRFSSGFVLDASPFDAAVCVDVLEHIQDDTSFISQIAQAVRPGGRFLLHVPGWDQWHPLAEVREMTARQIASGTGPHVREGYGRETLIDLLTRTGWRVETVQPTFGRLAALWTDLDMALSLRGPVSIPVRVLFFPLTVLGAVLARHWRPRFGNGWLVLAVRSVRETTELGPVESTCAADRSAEPGAARGCC